MEVKKLVCDVCGGQIEMQLGGKGICTSCGTPYSADIIKDKIQEIRGTVKVDGPVETVKGDAEKERLIKTAQECFRKGALNEAEKMFVKISDDYPNEWKAWMGIIYCRSLSLTNESVKTRFIDWKENPETFLKDEYKKAMLFAPEEEQLKIKNYVHNFRKVLNRRIDRQKMEIELDNKKTELKAKEYESTSNYKFGNGLKIGLFLILVGWLLFFWYYYIDSVTIEIIGLALIINGHIVFFKSSPIYEIRSYFYNKHRMNKAIDDVAKIKEDIRQITAKLNGLKDSLEEKENGSISL